MEHIKVKTKYNKSETLMGYLFALPWILGFVLLMAFPFGYSIYLAMTNMSTNSFIVEFRGLSNFKTILTDSEVWISIRNTFWYVGMSVPLNLIFALCLAMLLRAKVHGTKVYRALFYIPTLVSIVPVSLLWLQIFNSRNGILNMFLSLFGITGPAWLYDSAWATPALVLMSMWSCGGIVVIFVAALTDVPATLYEAAELDGASKLRQFFWITIPMLSPILFYNLLVNTVASFQVFAQPMMMTQGSYDTNYFGYEIYNTAFSVSGRLGYASAMGWVMLVIILGVSMIIRFLQKKFVFYND